MAKYKVVIAENMGQSGIDYLTKHESFNVVKLTPNEMDEIKKELSNADVLLVRSAIKVTAELLDCGKQLKYVGRAGAGVDNIDIDECSKRGIMVLRTLGGNSNGVVELTVGNMIALSRFIPRADKLMKEGIWAKGKLTGTELKGKTLGLLGYGRIGGDVAKICQVIGMDVLVYDPILIEVIDAPKYGRFVKNLDELLKKADYISLHVPLNDHTRGMIGKEQFEMMKPTSFIVNASRGAVINEAELFSALKDGKIAGAAIDVYSTEPSHKDQFPFIELDNVIATPHLGATTSESQENVALMIAEHIENALLSNIYKDSVNKDAALLKRELKK